MPGSLSSLLSFSHFPLPSLPMWNPRHAYSSFSSSDRMVISNSVTTC